MTPQVQVIDVTHRFGTETVLDAVGFEIAKGELVSLLGPSGCGKTTLLRALAGLITPTVGSILFAGRDVTRTPAHRRNVGVVFQNYALFPHLNVRDNVAFGLRIRGAAAAQVADDVAQALAMVRLEGFAKRSVRELSGGQQQRVALARALVTRPELLLLDEPFAALDRKLREEVQIELRELLRRLQMTAIFVTHDQEEALILSDRIAVMNRGVIEQIDRPRVLYDRPVSGFVLDFIGKSNRVEGTVRALSGTRIEIDSPLGPISAVSGFIPGSRVVVGVRPEAVAVVDAVPADHNGVDATLVDRRFVGSRSYLSFATPRDQRLLVEASDAAGEGIDAGQRVRLAWHVRNTFVFPVPAR